MRAWTRARRAVDDDGAHDHVVQEPPTRVEEADQRDERRQRAALVVLLLLALAIGVMLGVTLGYGVRASISRRRRVAAREAAHEERFRELSADHTLPRLE